MVTCCKYALTIRAHDISHSLIILDVISSNINLLLDKYLREICSSRVGVLRKYVLLKCNFYNVFFILFLLKLFKIYITLKLNLYFFIRVISFFVKKDIRVTILISKIIILK